MEKTVKSVGGRQWKVVYTKPRSEKKITERLEKEGYEVYCPLQTILKQWSDRKKKISVPVFPSYVFLHVNALESDEVLQDPGVLNFVYWLSKPAIIRDEEINSLKTFLTNNKDKPFEILNYKEGENVEIISGPFKGQHGAIDRVKRGALSLLIESLGMIIRVELNPELIKVCERQTSGKE
jgi:transcription antitermination factor NusG